MTSDRPERDEAGLMMEWESREVAEAWRQMRAQDRGVFAAATERMLDLAGVGAGDREVDVAAGTGEQTLAAARCVGPTGSVLATDISASMLAVAADVLRQEGWSNVETLVANAQRLDLPPDSLDAAISRFGVMLIPAHQEALAAIRRALKPGGKLAAMVWLTAERNPFFALPLGILQARGLLPPSEPGQPEPGPFALGTPDALERRFPAGRVPRRGHRAGGAPLALPVGCGDTRLLPAECSRPPARNRGPVGGARSGSTSSPSSSRRSTGFAGRTASRCLARR